MIDRVMDLFNTIDQGDIEDLTYYSGYHYGYKGMDHIPTTNEIWLLGYEDGKGDREND